MLRLYNADSQAGDGKPKRLEFIDAAKGFGILMIMYGHVTSLSNPIDTWMSSFKVTIFYILTGMVYAYSRTPYKRTFTSFTSRIFRAELIPYAWFCALGIIYKTARVFLKHKGYAAACKTFVTYLADAVFLKGINSLWFLPTMIIGVLVFYALAHSHKVIKVLYALVGPFFIMLFRNAIAYIALQCGEKSVQFAILSRALSAAGKGLMAAWFVGVGFFLFYAYTWLKDRMSLKLAIGIVLSLINIYISLHNTHVDINVLKDGIHPSLFYLGSIIGSFGLILILDTILSAIDLSFLRYLGRNSLILMATHTVFGIKDIAYQGWKHVVFIPNHAGLEYYCECFVVLIIMTAIEYSVIELINRRMPFLLGKPGLKPSNG